MTGKTTDKDTKRAREIAAKLHKAADKFLEIRDALREVETLLADEPFEATRFDETAEVVRIRRAIFLLSRPTIQQAYVWDGYADARAHG